MANFSDGPGILVDGPTCVPAPFGLFSVAEVEDVDNGHWVDGNFHEQLDCGDLLTVTDFCEPHTKADAAGEVSFPESDGFTVIAGYKCSTVGETLQVAWDRAKERMDQGEQRSVERVFWTGLDGSAVPAQVSPGLGQNADVVDLTPLAGAVSITDGLALLESWAGENMSCSPVIHANRGLGVYFAERNLVDADQNNGVLRSTGTGSRIVIGGGYLVNGPSGDAPASGEGWIYITGSIKVRRGPVFYTPDRGDDAGAMDRTINDVEVFAERFYSFSIECGVAAIRVNLCSAT